MNIRVELLIDSTDYVLVVYIVQKYTKDFLSNSFIIFIKLLSYKTIEYTIDCFD